MKVGDTFKIEIIDDDNLGNGIAKVDNIVVFIPGTIKGDIVNIEITNIKKRYIEAKLLKIIYPSNNRIIPQCKYYDKCGGCNFLHTTYKYEREIKRKYLERLFNKKIEYLPTTNELNYRNKITLHISNGKIGMYDEKSHNIFDCEKCLLVNDKINKTIDDIKKFDLTHISEIMIRCINNKIMISVTSTLDDINIKNIKCDSLYINNNLIKGEEYLIDEINGLKFSVYPDSFYQINSEGMINIYNKAKEFLSNDNSLLDLYCGTGTIAIWMKDKFKSIKGIEINKQAIKNAKINLELNNIKNIEFECKDASNIKEEFTSVIVDPPRNGLTTSVIDYLNYSNTKKLVYISCNANTLKRDLDKLVKFELMSIACADMFPRTKHCEIVCLLEKRL